MDEIEFFVLVLSGLATFVFFRKWYRRLFSAWPPERVKPARRLFGLLPVVSLAIIVYTLTVLASFDVVGSFFYIIFYIFIGYAWIYFGLILMAFMFDISWIDDALNQNNKSAQIAVAGGFLGLTIIYSAANIGDGPGWWCVIFAGGLGLIAWTLLALLANLFTKAFERVTVDRDVSCGIRFGSYLLASGLIFGRASAGDWTSFYMTVIEFLDGWPVLPLTALMIVVERYYINKSESGSDFGNSGLSSSVLWGIIYIVAAVACILMLPPLPENPLYNVRTIII